MRTVSSSRPHLQLARPLGNPLVNDRRSPRARRTVSATRTPSGVAILRCHREVEHGIDVDIIEHQHRRMPAEFHGRALHAAAASCVSCLPTGIDPVKCTARITGDEISCCETSDGTPNTICSTPAAHPASTMPARWPAHCPALPPQASGSRAARSKCGTELARGGLPSGKFHGANAATGPPAPSQPSSACRARAAATRVHRRGGLLRIPVEDLRRDGEFHASLGERLASSIVARRATGSTRSRNSAAAFCRMRPRSRGPSARHFGHARCAAASARSRSAGVASGTSPSTAPVAGLITGCTRRPAAPSRSPSTSR